MPLIRYAWEDDHVSFVLAIETGDPDSYREAIGADDHDKWIIAIEYEMEFLDRSRSFKGLKGNRLQMSLS